MKAQVEHEEEGERATRDECVDEDENSVHANDDSHVSNRHMTWWRHDCMVDPCR